MPQPPFDDPLTLALMRLDRRRRGVALGRGLGIALAIGAVAGLLGIGLDLLFVLAQSARWLVWGAWLGAIGLTLAISVMRAMARPADLLALASRAEHADPESSRFETLTAAAGLMRQPHGSPALIAALAEQAGEMARSIDPSRVIPKGSAVRRLAIGSALLGLLVAPAALAPAGATRTRVRRLLVPWANLGRPGAFAIVVEPGDGRAALGSRPTIHVTARADRESSLSPDEAWVEWRDVQADGAVATSRIHRLAMEGAAGQFSAALPRLKGAVAYRAVAGPAPGPTSNAWWDLDPATSASPWYRLDAAEPPNLVGLRARIEPPPYTGLPAKVTPLDVGVGQAATIEAWQDSRITLDVSADLRLGKVAIGFEADGPAGSMPAPADSLQPGTIAADRRSASASFRAERSGILAISLADEAGIAGAAVSLVRLAVRVDAPPTVSVLERDREAGEDATKATPLEARPDDVLRIGVTASDDVAVASAELHAEVERADPSDRSAGKTPDRVALKLPGLGTPRVRGEAALELAPLGLNPGDRLTYRVRVADNRPAPRGANVAWSAARSVSIVRRADSLAQRRRDTARAAVQAQLDALKRSTAKLRQEAERLRYAADAARQGSGPWGEDRQRDLAGREDDAGRLVGDLHRLADAFATPIRPQVRSGPEADAEDHHALAPAAREAADREGESSRVALERARRTRPEAPKPEAAESASKRLDALREADTHLAGLATRLDEIQARFDATKPGGKKGQGGDGQASDVASKGPQSRPDSGQPDKEGEARSDRQGGGEAAGAAKAGGAKMAGKGQAKGAGQAGKPGSGPAPAGYPAAYEEAEPGPEAGSGDLAALRNALQDRSGRAWAELPGQLRSRLLRMPQVRFRDEYSRQIERYYRELAEPTRASAVERRPDE